MKTYRNTIKQLWKANIVVGAVEVASQWMIVNPMRTRMMKRAELEGECTKSGG